MSTPPSCCASRQQSQTLFLRYGWVSSCNEYENFAKTYPDEYAYELWFGHRGLARASLDARDESLASIERDVETTDVITQSENIYISDMYPNNDMSSDEVDEDLLSFDIIRNDVTISKDLDDDDDYNTF